MKYEQFQLYLLLATTSFGTLVMKENYLFHSDLKVVLVFPVTTSLEHFTFFLLGLSDLDDSSIFIFLSSFFKKLLTFYLNTECASLIETLQHSHF